eukprot:3167692-Prorocentrum_lima.AAC.1
MGFVQAARPQHMVSEHIYQELCRADWAREASNQQSHTQTTAYDTLMQRAEHMRVTATNGGLLELNAACATYYIQVVICAKAKD